MSIDDIDPIIDIAKSCQMDIDTILDPFDAALEANKALALINSSLDRRFVDGANIIVRATGAYALNLWIEERDRFVDFRYEPLVVQGGAAGFSFIQRNLGDLFIKTVLFIGVRNGDVIERQTEEDGATIRNFERVPRILVPVKEIQSVRLAA